MAKFSHCGGNGVFVPQSRALKKQEKTRKNKRKQEKTRIFSDEVKKQKKTRTFRRSQNKFYCLYDKVFSFVFLCFLLFLKIFGVFYVPKVGMVGTLAHGTFFEQRIRWILVLLFYRMPVSGSPVVVKSPRVTGRICPARAGVWGISTRM
jgi:Fe2+ transport system protein B